MAHDEVVRRLTGTALPSVARRALGLERLVLKEGDLLWVADGRGDVRPPLPPLSRPAGGGGSASAAGAPRTASGKPASVGPAGVHRTPLPPDGGDDAAGGAAGDAALPASFTTPPAPSTTPPAPSTTPPAPSTTPPAPSTTPPAPSTGAPGLFADGAAYLAWCALTVEGQRLPAPAAAELDGYEARLAFPALDCARDDLSLFRTFVVDGAALRQWIAVESQRPRPESVTLIVTLGMGGDAAAGGAAAAPSRPALLDGVAYLTAEDARGRVRRTAVAFDRAPADARWLDGEATGHGALLALTFRLRPALAEPDTLALTISPEPTVWPAVGVGGDDAWPGAAAAPAGRERDAARPRSARRSGGKPTGPARRDADGTPLEPARRDGDDARPVQALGYDEAVRRVRERRARWHLEGARFTTDLPVLDGVLRTAAADLRTLLRAGDAGGAVPVAGLPGAARVRGREALLAALLALPLQPRIAVDTLRLLARHQPARDDAARGLAAGQIPHLLDGATTAPADLGAALETTPLWLALLGETVDWTGDADLLDELLPAARRAVGWMRRAASHGGYLRVGAPGVAAEWRADRPDAAGAPEPDSAPLAPQVYAYVACRALARVLCRSGAGDDRAWPGALELTAEALRLRIERDFWVGRHGCYAPALDRAGRPIGGATSATAYALWGGVASRPRAQRAARRLAAPDMSTGWGLRSRSTADPAYDPFGAATGCIWPHETALAAAGIWRAGGQWAGPQLARSFFVAAASQLDGHLAERHAGDVRSGAHLAAPRPCPGASMPAAVAAASPFALLGAILGLEPDGLARRLIVRPSLPAWLTAVQVRHLRVGDGRVDLEIRRPGVVGRCGVEWQVTDGEVDVVVLPAVDAR